MKFIKYTYVDSVTKISIEKQPAQNGPASPEIKGLKYLFSLERKYPTEVPEFIGECDDDANINTDGILKQLKASDLEYEQIEEQNSQKKRIRDDRNARLILSDWTQVDDAPVDKEAWAVYRQSLRDIPQQSGFPTTVDWPTVP